MTSVERHYTTQQVAGLLGLDYETVLMKAQSGEIASVRISRLRRFPESAVQNYLHAHRDAEREESANAADQGLVDVETRIAMLVDQHRVELRALVDAVLDEALDELVVARIAARNGDKLGFG